MNNKVKFFSLACLVCSLFGETKAVSEKNVKWWALGVGGLTTVAVGGTSYYFLNGRVLGPVSGNNLAKSSALGLGAGGLAGWAAYEIAKRCTPKSRYLRAERKVRAIANNPLMLRQFYSEDEFVRHILGAGRFGKDWPLVFAADYFDRFWGNLNDAYNLIEKARSESIKDGESSWIIKKCDELSLSINQLFDVIADRKGAIMSHPAYDRQYNKYQKFKIEEAKRKQREKDRWAKMAMHHEKMKQKDKDREAAQRRHDANREAMLQASQHGNARVNVGFNANC